MGDGGACWDHVVVERFSGSQRARLDIQDGQPAGEHMKKDVAAYMRYYNLERLHTANGDQSPANDEEHSLKKCPVGLDPYTGLPGRVEDFLGHNGETLPSNAL